MAKPEFGFDTTAEEVAEYFKDQIKDKVVLTTGVSPNSLGAYYVQTIAAHAPKSLILAGRDIAKLKETADAIRKAHPDVPTRLLELDLADMAQIREAANEVHGYAKNIDVLMNNAGVMASPYMTTKDGLEMQFGVGHIGHFLFTNLIMDKILAAGGHPRIINVSSSGHRISPIRFEDWDFSEGKTYNRWRAYGQTKTANIAFSVELARRYGSRGLESFSLHPGSIWTNLGRHLTDFENDFEELRKIDLELGNEEGNRKEMKLKQLPAGTATHVVASFEPDLSSHNGEYLLNCRLAKPEEVRSNAYDPVQAQKLWKLSEEIVGQKFD